MPNPPVRVRPSILPNAVATPLKRAITANVVAVFNDRARGEQPVQRQQDGLFGPGSVVWRVHGDVASMMVGGITGLLMQMLHPAVLAGVWDHSNFRADMRGRLRRTARFIALTTYGGKTEAEAAIARVRRIHDKVTGVLLDGTPYAANDPASLAWVHVTEATSFLDAWIRYVEPRMSIADQNGYFTQMAQVGQALGADPVPHSRQEATDLLDAMRPHLRCDARTREIARLILGQPAQTIWGEPIQALTMDAAIDLLPPWAIQMHRLHPPTLTKPLVRLGTLRVAQTLRWAFS